MSCGRANEPIGAATRPLPLTIPSFGASTFGSRQVESVAAIEPSILKGAFENALWTHIVHQQAFIRCPVVGLNLPRVEEFDFAQAVDGLSIHLAPQAVEIVEAMVLLLDDDNMLELIYGHRAGSLRHRRYADDDRNRGIRLSNVHDKTPKIPDWQPPSGCECRANDSLRTEHGGLRVRRETSSTAHWRVRATRASG